MYSGERICGWNWMKDYVCVQNIATKYGLHFAAIEGVVRSMEAAIGRKCPDAGFVVAQHDVTCRK
jgi:hypothetical protein